MKFFLGILRVFRAVFGYLGVLVLGTSCLRIAPIPGSPEPAVLPIFEIIVGSVFFILFMSIRWGINSYHKKKFGEPFPALKNFWAL